MNTQENKLAQETRSILEECFEQIRLARAIELAHSKRFLEAVAILSPKGRFPESPNELDLLARIAAQQKHFREAKRLWEAALQKEPNNEHYGTCIKRLEQVEHCDIRRKKLMFFGLVLVFSTVLVFFAIRLWPRHSDKTPGSQIPAKSQGDPQHQQQDPKHIPPNASGQAGQQKPLQPVANPKKK